MTCCASTHPICRSSQQSARAQMRVHHLNCGTINVFGGVAMIGTGGLLRRAPGVSHCILVETDDGLLLVDTGSGTRDYAAPTPMMRWLLALSGSPRDPAETAVAQVRGLGYAPDDVKHIVLTHFHYDHAGGLPDFPQAKVHIYAGEHAALMRPRTLEERFVYRREHWAHRPAWVVHDLRGDRWFGFDCTPSVELDPTVFTLVPLPGHTRGHCGVALRLQDGWLFHCGDAYTYHGDVDPQNPRKPPYYRAFRPYFGMTSAFRAIGRHSPRLRDLLRAHGDEVRLTCTHDPHEFRKLANKFAQQRT